MKTILNLQFLLGFMGAAAAFCLYCSHDTTKRTNDTKHSIESSSCLLVVIVDFCFVIQAQQQTLCIKNMYNTTKSTQFKIHAVYYHLYVNFGRLLLKFEEICER